MEYKIERTGYNVKMSIELTAVEWDAAIEKAYQKTKEKYKVAGFRPGKVPRKLLEKTYGQGIFFDDAFNECFPQYYSEIIEKEKFDPIDRPDVDFDDITEDGVKFSARVIVRPEVKLGAYQGLTLERTVYNLEESEIDGEINTARERNARKITVSDRAAAKGDFATIDYSGSVDGVKFEGGTAEKHELELGSNSFIPGFEEQVEGMNAGESKDVSVTFPEDYHADNLKGKKAVFHVVLHELKVKELPELDDEFAKDVSEFDTMKDYRDSIAKKLQEAKDKRTEVGGENALLDLIAKNAEIDIPDIMIEQQIDHFIEDFQYRLYYQGMKMDDYLKYTGTKMEDLRNSRREEAKHAVKVRLVIEEIIDKEKLVLDDKDIEAKIEELAKRNGKTVEEFRSTVKDRQLDYVKNDAIMDKVIKLLKSTNKFIDKPEGKKPADKPEGKKPAAKKTDAKSAENK